MAENLNKSSSRNQFRDAFRRPNNVKSINRIAAQDPDFQYMVVSNSYDHYQENISDRLDEGWEPVYTTDEIIDDRVAGLRNKETAEKRVPEPYKIMSSDGHECYLMKIKRTEYQKLQEKISAETDRRFTGESGAKITKKANGATYIQGGNITIKK